MADQQQSPGLLANILAVAGFIILIVIIVWGAYHLLRLTGSGVTSIFSRFSNDADIAITVPPGSIQSGKSFPISWKYETEAEGNYAFLYQCKAGFRFDIPAQSGSTVAVPCGNAFTVGDAKALTLVPTLSGTSSLDIPFTVVFMPTATSTDERPQGTATVTVTSSNTGTVTPPPVAPTQPSEPSTPVTPGTPDLSVKILAVGVIDMNGMFVPRQPMHAGEIAAVKFDIANNGSASTGNWYFNVQLPMQGSYTYSSPVQMSLAPGAHIENTLRFRPVASGGGTIVVNVDSTGAVAESNEGNNSSSLWLNAPTFPNQYYAPYVY